MIALLCAVTIFPGLAQADPIGVRTTARIATTGGGTCFDVGSGYSNCAVTERFTPPDGFVPPRMGTATTTATVLAGFGFIDAAVDEFAILDDGDEFPLFGYDLQATAEFNDILTVTGGSGNGFIQYSVSGDIRSSSVDLDPTRNSWFQFAHDGSVVQNIGNAGFPDLGTTVSGLFTYTSPLLPFTFGVPFELYGFGQAATYTLIDDCCGYGILSVSMDVLNVFDANQQLVDARILRASDTVTAIPEPTSLLLLGLGLAGSYAGRRWNHRAH